MGIAFTFDDRGLAERFANAPEKVREARDTTIQRFMLGFLTRLQTERLNGSPIKRRTGNLANQWSTVAISTPAQTVAAVKSLAGLDQFGKGYSLLQEYGGDVRPVSSKYLWIPIGDNLTESGVPRMTPTQAIQAGGFIAWNKGPIFFGVDQKGRSKKSGGVRIHPLFVLKKSVHVEGRMGANTLWTEESHNLLPMMADAVKEAIRG